MNWVDLAVAEGKNYKIKVEKPWSELQKEHEDQARQILMPLCKELKQIKRDIENNKEKIPFKLSLQSFKKSTLKSTIVLDISKSTSNTSTEELIRN